jgi:hypothetical protein
LTRQLALNVPFEDTGTVFDAQRPFESIETTTCSPPVADARSPRTITVPTRARTRPRVVRFSPRAKPGIPTGSRRVEEAVGREHIRGATDCRQAVDGRRADDLWPPRPPGIGGLQSAGEAGIPTGSRRVEEAGEASWIVSLKAAPFTRGATE